MKQRDANSDSLNTCVTMTSQVLVGVLIRHIILVTGKVLTSPFVGEEKEV